MTIYTQISKQIGWEGSSVIPTLETAQNLHLKVTEEKCQLAFKQVFIIYRFAELSATRMEAKAMALIEDAYSIGRKQFS